LVRRKAGEFDLFNSIHFYIFYINKLLGVKTSVVISGLGDGSGDKGTSSIYSLPLVLEVNSSGDFLDQDWGKSVGSKLLVDTKEVDFSSLELGRVGVYSDWDTCDKTDKFFILLDSDTC